MSSFRIEKDSLGEMQVPADAYYGASTARAIHNFPISGEPMPREFIQAHVLLKKAAATVNRDLGLLKSEYAAAIIQAADEILADAEWSRGQFPIDIYQTGSGTSTNTNVNEVLATRANEILANGTTDRSPEPSRAHRNLASIPKLIHPNDHVNLGQSSNDTIPTSMHLMAIRLHETLLRPALGVLSDSLRNKAQDLSTVIKTGRTHLQDATPINMGDEFLGYSFLVTISEFAGETSPLACNLPLGGTAVGSGINTSREFAPRVCKLLAEWYGTYLGEADEHFSAQSTLDSAVRFHAFLKSLALSLLKIANDIRWMASGPRAGLGEIELPAVQPGSSIMPGKVNPVIIESLLMVCQRVIGNDAAMTAAAQAANFELAMSMPLAAKLLHESITLLANACTNFAKNCVDGIKATERGPALVESGLMLATALVPAIGYDAAASIAKEAAATGRTIRQVAREKTRLTEEQLTKLLDPNTMVGNANPPQSPEQLKPQSPEPPPSNS